MMRVCRMSDGMIAEKRFGTFTFAVLNIATKYKCIFEK